MFVRLRKMEKEESKLIRETWENALKLADFMFEKFYKIPWDEFGNVDPLTLMMALEILAGNILFLLCRKYPESKDAYMRIFRTVNDNLMKVAEKAESLEP